MEENHGFILYIFGDVLYKKEPKLLYVFFLFSLCSNCLLYENCLFETHVVIKPKGHNLL